MASVLGRLRHVFRSGIFLRHSRRMGSILLVRQVCLFGLVDEPIGWIFGDLQQGHFATLPQEPVQD